MGTIEEVAAHRIVPVVVLESAADASPLADALVAGGLPVAEVTFRTAAAAESIRIMSARGDLLVGAGTVITPEQVDQAVDAGASYIVSPGTSLAVIERAQHHGVAVLPGAVTPTEIQRLLELGIDTVKFFPANIYGGIAGIKGLSAPFGQVKFVPTGGVSLSNLADYLAVPAVAAVGGSWMVPAGLVNAGEFETIRKLTSEAVAAVAGL